MLDWEPHRALFADKGGLFFVEKLLRQGALYLKPDGTLYVEFGKGQEKGITRLMEENGWTGKVHPDQYGIPRWCSATKKSS